MLRHCGRAATEIAHTVHRVCAFLLTLTVMLSLAVLGVSWRLSRGPVDLDYFKDRIEAAVNRGTDPVRVTFGGVSIAWGGFSRGLDQPLILRVIDLTVVEAAGSAGVQIPVAEAALSARWLFVGRIVPRAITLEGARLVLVREADGSLSFQLGDSTDATAPSPVNGLLAVLGAPVTTDRQARAARWSQLSAVSIQDATLGLDDRVLGMTWTAERADIDLSRRRDGGMDGQAALTLAISGQKAAVTGKFTMERGARSVHVAARLAPVTPKALAGAAPVLAPLAALDAPLTIESEADLGPDLIPVHLRMTARAGAGTINGGGGSIPIRRAELTVAGTMEQATLERAVLELQPAPGADISTLTARGTLTRREGRVDARLHLTLDHVGFADLPALWPADIAPPARAWITGNITSGTAYNGAADVMLESPEAAPDVTVIDASGTLEGDDLSVTWLPTVPGVEQGRAHLAMPDLDTIAIDIRSARQKVNGAAPIALQNGHVTVTGVSGKDQVATIRCEANGVLPRAIGLLKEPRLHILDKHPIDLRAPAGDVRMALRVVVPLVLRLQIDDVTIHGTGNLSKVRLAGIAAGRDLDDGALSFDVDTNRLAIKGTARVAAIPANIDVLMDFRGGPASQVTQRYAASARAAVPALAAAGLDAGDMLAGEVGLNLVFNTYRSGDGEMTVDADLGQSVLSLAPLAWKKQAGDAAKGSARLTLSKDRLTGIDRITVDGPGILVRGAITVFDGKLDVLRLDRVHLGRTDVGGTIRLPHDTPIGVDLTGPALDVSAKLQEKRPKRDQNGPEPRGPRWSMRGRFDRVFLAHDHIASRVAVTAQNDGNVMRELLVAGRTGAGKPFSVRIAPDQAPNSPAMRRLTIIAEDAGSLMQGLDITDSIQGGVLTVAGDFNDATRDHTLSGTLEFTDFRVARAPVLGKLLQAVTLYGLVDALGGPGMSFSRLTAPFRLDDDSLTLSDARAFSPSLGLTAKGRIDRTGDRLDLEGTLVPAYVFNSMLGRIPLIGGLFSAEKGGGLFAMNYSLRGPTDNPTVAANPLSALTPGILRGMFGLFDQPPARRQPRVDRETAGGNAQQP